MRELITESGINYCLSGFHGRVVGLQVVSETSHHSGHSNGRRYSSSATHTTKSFFLLNDAGQEKAFSFSDRKLPAMRDGHIVQVMWLSRENAKTGKYFLVRNVTLNEEFLDVENIKQVYLDKKTALSIFLISIGVVILIGFAIVEFAKAILSAEGEGTFHTILGILLLVVVCVVLGWGNIRNRKRYSRMTSEVYKRAI